MRILNLLKDHTSRTRSIAKAFTWRILATMTTAVIAYGVIGEASAAFAIGSIEFILKFFIYYIHEQAWNLVQ